MRTDPINQSTSRSAAEVRENIRRQGEAEIARAQKLAQDGAQKIETGDKLHQDSVVLGTQGQSKIQLANQQLNKAGVDQLEGVIRVETGLMKAIAAQVGQLQSLEDMRKGIDLQQLAADDKQVSMKKVKKGLVRAEISENYQQHRVDKLDSNAQAQAQIHQQKDVELVNLKGGLVAEREAEKDQDSAAKRFKNAEPIDETGGLLKGLARRQLEVSQDHRLQANLAKDQSTQAGLKAQELQNSAQVHRTEAEQLRVQASENSAQAQSLLAKASELESAATAAQTQAQQLAELSSQEKVNAEQAAAYSQRWHQIGHCHIHQGQAMLMCPFTHCAGHHMIHQGQHEIGISHQWCHRSKTEQENSEKHAIEANCKKDEAERLQRKALEARQQADQKLAIAAEQSTQAEGLGLQASAELQQSQMQSQISQDKALESQQLSEKADKWQKSGLSLMKEGGALQELAQSQQSAALQDFDISRESEAIAGSQQQVALSAISGALGQEQSIHLSDFAEISKMRSARKREDKALLLQRDGIDDLHQDIQVSREGIEQTQHGLNDFVSQTEKEMQGLKLENQGYRLLEEARALREQANDNTQDGQHLLEQASSKETEARSLISQGQSMQQAAKVIDNKGQAYLRVSQSDSVKN